MSVNRYMYDLHRQDYVVNLANKTTAFMYFLFLVDYFSNSRESLSLLSTLNYLSIV